MATKQAVIGVGGMSCQGCVKNVTGALAATAGVASGTSSGSPSGRSPSTPSGRGKIRRMAITKRMMPPAIAVDSRDRPRPLRILSPKVRNSISSARASSSSRRATRMRRSGATFFSAAR